MRSPDVPIRIRSRIVQVHIRSVTIRAVVAIAADKRDRARKTPKAHRIPLFYILLSVFSMVGEGVPHSPSAAYAAEGCSQEREAPKDQFAVEAAELKST